jgi:hypothetical protein
VLCNFYILSCGLYHTLRNHDVSLGGSLFFYWENLFEMEFVITDLLKKFFPTAMLFRIYWKSRISLANNFLQQIRAKQVNLAKINFYQFSLRWCEARQSRLGEISLEWSWAYSRQPCEKSFFAVDFKIAKI